MQGGEGGAKWGAPHAAFRARWEAEQSGMVMIVLRTRSSASGAATGIAGGCNTAQLGVDL